MTLNVKIKFNVALNLTDTQNQSDNFSEIENKLFLWPLYFPNKRLCLTKKIKSIIPPIDGSVWNH